MTYADTWTYLSREEKQIYIAVQQTLTLAHAIHTPSIPQKPISTHKHYQDVTQERTSPDLAEKEWAKEPDTNVIYDSKCAPTNAQIAPAVINHTMRLWQGQQRQTRSQKQDGTHKPERTAKACQRLNTTRRQR